MKRILLLLLLIMCACTTEPVRSGLQNGFLTFRGSIPDFTASKIPVPACSEFTPNEIYYKLIRPDNGTTHIQTSPIVIEGNQIYSTGEMTFPEGTYLVDEVSLRYNGVVTHTAPQENDPRYDFAAFVDKPLPYTLTILPGQTTEAKDQVLCYSEAPIDLSNEFSWVGEVVELQTMYFYVPEGFCFDRVVVWVDNIEYFQIPLTEYGLYAIPIPFPQSGYQLRAYVGDFITENLAGTTYNIDRVLDESDIRFFHLNCN